MAFLIGLVVGGVLGVIFGDNVKAKVVAIKAKLLGQ